MNVGCTRSSSLRACVRVEASVGRSACEEPARETTVACAERMFRYYPHTLPLFPAPHPTTCLSLACLVWLWAHLALLASCLSVSQLPGTFVWSVCAGHSLVRVA